MGTSSHRIPGALLFVIVTGSLYAHPRMFCNEFPFRLRASTRVDSLKESSPAFPWSVGWGTVFAWARTGLSWHSSTSPVRPWQKCLRRSHASTSGRFSVVILRLRPYEHLLCGRGLRQPGKPRQGPRAEQMSPVSCLRPSQRTLRCHQGGERPP